jgi:putative transposase
VFITQKYKLYPDKESRKQLRNVLDLQKGLYNAARQERVDAYKKFGKNISLFDQIKSLTEIRANDQVFSDLPLTLSRGTLQRLDETFKGFFRRVKQKGSHNPGFPRYKKEMTSFQFMEFRGIRLVGKYLYIKSMSPIRINLHRPVIGNMRSCVIKVDNCGDWWICFQVITKIKPLRRTGSVIGIDSGLKSLLVTSDGELIENIRPGNKKSKDMRRRNRLLSRSKKTMKSFLKKKIRVARLHRQINDQRRSYLHMVSSKLVKEHDTIYAEKLNLKGLIQTRLASSFQDAAIGLLHQMISYKAEWAGKKFVQVDPRYTSQDCSRCKQRKKMPLSIRIYKCDGCGLELDRDVNAAINILHKGAVPLGVPKPTGGVILELSYESVALI